jgi:hypothetical protein
LVVAEADVTVGYCVPQPKIRDDESFLRCAKPGGGSFHYKQSFICTWLDDSEVDLPLWTHPKVE